MDNLNTSKITLGNYQDTGIENIVFTNVDSPNTADKVDLGDMKEDLVLEETEKKDIQDPETPNNGGNMMLFGAFFLLLLLFRKKS
jgi:hypothetical protein